jgi:hypothetical protein
LRLHVVVQERVGPVKEGRTVLDVSKSSKK